jgi:hypothetical protein
MLPLGEFRASRAVHGSMNENFKYIAGAVAVVGLSVGAIVYFSMRNERAEPAEQPVVAAPVTPALPEEPAVRHPLPDADTEQALPSLDDSDGSMLGALEGLIGKSAVEQFVVSKDLVRHVVVAVDNLTTEKVAERIRPLKPTPGSFAVSGPEEALVLDPANYERYQGLVQLVRSVDTATLIATYKRHYPLFQEAYASLGHPPEYFNDRLVEVIDHLLATPQIPGPIALAQPGVLYVFADPAIESRSAGQKALIRMGGENAAAVKAKLSELRSALVAQPSAN